MDQRRDLVDRDSRSAIFVDQNSPSFGAVRAMFGLLLIALIVYAIAMMPRFGVAAWMKKKASRKTDKT